MKTNDEIIYTLENLKEDQNMSLSELARRVGMAKSALSRYFNKQVEFPLNRLEPFAKALKTTPEDILGIPHIDTRLLEIISRLNGSNTKQVQRFAEFILKEQNNENLS